MRLTRALPGAGIPKPTCTHNRLLTLYDTRWSSEDTEEQLEAARDAKTFESTHTTAHVGSYVVCHLYVSLLMWQCQRKQLDCSCSRSLIRAKDLLLIVTRSGVEGDIRRKAENRKFMSTFSAGVLVSCPDTISHEEKDLVTIKPFLGCAESAVLILNKHSLYAWMM